MLYKNLNITRYLEKVIELLEISPLENQFQDFIVYPVIESVLLSKPINDLDLVDCHNFAQYNTQAHDRCNYSVLVRAVPDLLIAKDFFYYNRGSDIRDRLKPIAAVEVKVPNTREITAGDKKSVYSGDLYREILPTLFKCKKYILTNIQRWDFLNVANVRDENLLSDISDYVRILELCGFDKATDYENAKEDGKLTRKIRQEVLERKWKDAQQNPDRNGVIAEIIESEREPSEKAFSKMLSTADTKYEQHIKNFVDASLDAAKSVDIIKSPFPPAADRCALSVSDFQYDPDALDLLFTRLKSFL